MKMTKLLALLLSLVLVVGLFAGCGGEKEETKDEDTKVEDTNDGDKGSDEDKEPAQEGLVADITVQVEESWTPYYQAVADRVLEMNPDSTITFITTGSFDHLNVLDSTDVTNEDVADVFAFPADRIYGLAQNEALAEIDALAMADKVGGFGDYDAGLGGRFKIDGAYLGFPMNIESLAAFGNSMNAEANGVDLNGTLEMTELNHEDVIIPLFDAWFGVAVMNAGGFELLGKDDAGNLFTDMTKEYSELSEQQQAVFTGLYEYWKAHDEAGTDLWDAEAAWGYIDAQYTTGGNNSVRIDGPWALNGLSEKASNGDALVVNPISTVTIAGYPLNHWRGGWAVGVNARVEGEEEQLLLAQAFLEELLNPEYAVDFWSVCNKISPNVTADVYQNSDLSDGEKVVLAAVLASYETAVDRPLFSEWGQVWDTYKNGVLSWASVKPATVEEAYAEVKASFEAMMSNF